MASLCHDMGKIVSVFNHPAIAAEILKPYVRSEVYEMIREEVLSAMSSGAPPGESP